jgi:hypothetical protein
MSKTFLYNKPTENQLQIMDRLREEFCSLETLVLSLPASRQRSLALTKLEEAAMWANKGVTHDE